jgi:hypothetical protein
MDELELQILVRSSLITLLAAQGYGDWHVTAEYQPTPQGREAGPVLYFFELPENLYGWQGRKAIYDRTTGVMLRKEVQMYRSGFQVQGLYETPPDAVTGPTAATITRVAAMLINSQGFRKLLRAQGVFMERVTDIRKPYMRNDRDHFEQVPSFDFTCTHERSIIQQSTAASRVESRFMRV